MIAAQEGHEHKTTAQRLWRWLLALYLAGMLGAYLVRGIVAVEQNTNPSGYDQRSYLRLGLNIVEGRDLTDGKRHPALPALLSLIAERDWPFYTEAKFMELGIGVLCLILAFELGRRWFHPVVGATAAGLLSINESFLHVSSHVMAEPLLILLTLLGWYLMTRALDAPRPTAWRYAAAAGLVAGLAYLTKATALQLVPSFVLVAVWLARKQRGWWRRREIWVFLGCWLLAWLPLLVFNIQEYHNPLYNYNYQHEIYLDSPTERHFADISEAPTLATYLNSHTVGQMVVRMWYGIREVTRILFDTLWPGSTARLTGGLEIGWVLAWVALSAYLLTHTRRLMAAKPLLRPAFLLFGCSLVASLIPLGWFVQASNVGPRFIVVFQPMIYVMALGALLTLAQGREAARPATRRWLSWRTAFGAALVALLGWSLYTSVPAVADIHRDPVSIDREANAPGQAVLQWLDEGTPYGTRVLWGPGYTLPNWLFEPQLNIRDVPSKAESWADVESDARERSLAYLIVDWEMVGRRVEAFQPYFESDNPRVEIHALPPGWALMLTTDGMKPQWAILRWLEVLPIAHPQTATLGEAIAFSGYEYYPEPVAPGNTAYVTLFWQALETPAADYSVFVHVLDADGNLVAQADGMPLHGQYPTSAWQPDDQIGDRYDVALPADLPAGEYQVQVGMYRWDTLERVPAVDADGQPCADDAIVLDSPLQVDPAASGDVEQAGQ